MPHLVKLTEANIQECQKVRALLLEEKARSGMTYKILGKMIGKSEKTIAAIVTNRMRVTLDVGKKLAKVFGVPLSDILPWTATLGANAGEVADILEDLESLSPENREVARRLIHSLLDSQE